MKLIIEIPEENYKLICSDGRPFLESYKWIKNGTPIPKGHGRLIDVDNIQYIQLEDSLTVLTHTKGDEVDWYIDAPTILVADKAESEEQTE